MQIASIIIPTILRIEISIAKPMLNTTFIIEYNLEPTGLII